MQNKSRFKIWVCEFVSAGGMLHNELPVSLLHEGVLMRDALLADLHAIEVDCITSHDTRVVAPIFASSVPVSLSTPDIFTFWHRQLEQHSVDACWVIAPETDGILQQLQAMVCKSGKYWIGCTADAIRLSTDKVAMAQQCQSAGLPIITHELLKHSTQETLFKMSPGSGWVVKPRDGAGCDHIYYFNNIDQLIDFKELYSKEFPEVYLKLIVQPYLSGQTLSFSAIATAQAVQVIAVHQQHIHIEHDTRAVKLTGIAVNAAMQYLDTMQALASHIKTAIPGLTGYWGADVILQDDGQITLVEINPRLTTPYVLLSDLMPVNPAAMILDALLLEQLPVASACGQIELIVTQSTKAQTKVGYA